ncbi:uncharacterized protein ARMOST_13952 [Armillaria ostoyae]|uniref:Uncharacterized protein n=1 Tax=Armillaria ostoyae TaxID=47428 RepID=A0A284RPC0_ARMOS|nr:uncharacterized protein ARMOST_13952 [Armillaria ostoyae]
MPTFEQAQHRNLQFHNSRLEISQAKSPNQTGEIPPPPRVDNDYSALVEDLRRPLLPKQWPQTEELPDSTTDTPLLGDIEERMDNAKIRDDPAKDQKSLRLQKHLKRLAYASADKSPHVDIVIRMRTRDIDDGSKEKIIESWYSSSDL